MKLKDLSNEGCYRTMLGAMTNSPANLHNWINSLVTEETLNLGPSSMDKQQGILIELEETMHVSLSRSHFYT